MSNKKSPGSIFNIAGDGPKGGERAARRKRPPFSLRVRFLLATVAIVLALSLSYGAVAIIGYSINFDKTSFRLLRGESNLFYSLAQWRDNHLTIATSPDIDINFPTLVLIYDRHGNILWREKEVPELEALINPEWLKKTAYHELDTDTDTSSAVLKGNTLVLNSLKALHGVHSNTLTHSIAVNVYPRTEHLPPLTIVVVDRIPQELQQEDIVWEWFSYVFIANLILVFPLLWLAAHWSLRPIKNLVEQIAELENGTREQLDENPPRELFSLVSNLNILLNNERQRYHKYRTTLTDLTHSMKTPLAVLQTTLRALRTGKEINIDQAEPIMLEQISRISQQIGYYLHRASVRSEHHMLMREVHSVPALLDGLCSALNKVYQRKGVVLTLDISPELTFVGEKNDFMEVLGNVLDNACKYCLEFVEISAQHSDHRLHLIIDDDGPGIPESKRALIFQRGQRADRLRPGQGIGLSVAAEIIEQYQGEIIISDSVLGGARVEAIFSRQNLSQNEV
ncbi:MULTISPECIES: two-component system sensor histidine kinase PhoQ [unclassified Brenneria]|uniref:two-component system sensor histidine kinase PhoQ n=1 Tax=unclassified Brenneria TaxID=2634434 RepID=UPI0020A6C44E|nr:two-component system sensor histidine kinase PhoQ [Brenneria sp. hezel4-2-4]MEE3649421.1 two-component system sensor histidine kinase PhoQ [Brenneria sp. HEZEL_4_2_4]